MCVCMRVNNHKGVHLLSPDPEAGELERIVSSSSQLALRLASFCRSLSFCEGTEEEAHFTEREKKGHVYIITIDRFKSSLHLHTSAS